VSVPAAQVYYESVKPLVPPETEKSALSAQQEYDDVLDIADVTGKRIINTRLHRNITIREENATAALEVMSRFAANPKWLLYLPPTMSPPETSKLPGLLEHPAEAFGYYATQNVAQVVCEEKHMGSRAIVIICQNEDAARRRFGVGNEGSGICYTRTGRRFFEDTAIEAEFLARLRATLDRANFWTEFKTDWAAFDCELMPWSAKAQELLRQQYAAVGAASRSALPQTVRTLQATLQNNQAAEVTALLERYTTRQTLAEQYVRSYRRYCWQVNSVDDLRLAPFHLLATESTTHLAQNHVWHMDTIARIVAAQPDGEKLLMATPYKLINLEDENSRAEGIAWWEELTGRGGEGMVVKPLDFIAKGRRENEIVQPAVKCRGVEYLRIIYGPEYTLPENLDRLRWRGLGAKRSLALREFTLGVEGLERFVAHEPLRRVHECVFGVLALESEPVDPRL
jgi:protein phosphatase